MPTLHYLGYNDYTDEQVDMNREAYEALLDFCFSHSETVSFLIKDGEPIKDADWLEQFRISCPDGLDTSSHSERVYYTEEDHMKIVQWLEECKIAREKGIACPDAPPCEDKEPQDYHRYYKACPEIKQWMLDAVGSIFEWIDGWGYKNPEDPYFYREDGSVLFFSSIHDLLLEVRYRDDEDVTRLLLTDALWSCKRRIRGYNEQS